MQDSPKNLKYGYTTGSHAASALKAGLIALFNKNYQTENIEITLPDNKKAILKIDEINNRSNYTVVKVTKSDNDDIDVTKGCKINCYLSTSKTNVAEFISSIDHKPHKIFINGHSLTIYAGNGLGIATKEGLDAKIGYPAINPMPLKMMKSIFAEVIQTIKPVENLSIDTVFEVENGINMSVDTANLKVGVIGGISLIGKTGIVKPISTDAYLKSLEAEIKVASKNSKKRLILTMGNSSLKFAKSYYNLEEENYIEIGNYIFDTLTLLKKYNFKEVTISANIGKMTKIAQSKKNTNNRYGDVDFKLLADWLNKAEFSEDIIKYCKESTTVKAIEELVKTQQSNKLDEFYAIIVKNTLKSINNWSKEINLPQITFEAMLNDGEKLKDLCLKTF